MHLEHVQGIIGSKEGAPGFATVNALMLQRHTLFIANTFVNKDPNAGQLASMALMAANEIRRFGLPPNVAFLSLYNYGTSKRASALKMRRARE